MQSRSNLNLRKQFEAGPSKCFAWFKRIEDSPSEWKLDRTNRNGSIQRNGKTKGHPGMQHKISCYLNSFSYLKLPKLMI